MGAENLFLFGLDPGETRAWREGHVYRPQDVYALDPAGAADRSTRCVSRRYCADVSAFAWLKQELLDPRRPLAGARRLRRLRAPPGRRAGGVRRTRRAFTREADRDHRAGAALLGRSHPAGGLRWSSSQRRRCSWSVSSRSPPRRHPRRASAKWPRVRSRNASRSRSRLASTPRTISPAPRGRSPARMRRRPRLPEMQRPRPEMHRLHRRARPLASRRLQPAVPGIRPPVWTRRKLPWRWNRIARSESCSRPTGARDSPAPASASPSPRPRPGVTSTRPRCTTACRSASRSGCRSRPPTSCARAPSSAQLEEEFRRTGLPAGWAREE